MRVSAINVGPPLSILEPVLNIAYGRAEEVSIGLLVIQSPSATAARIPDSPGAIWTSLRTNGLAQNWKKATISCELVLLSSLSA